MRAFSPGYLRWTREGMWADSRTALESLDLASRTRILDVGSGTGALSRVLAADSGGCVVGCDVDRTLLNHAREIGPVVQGDATALPFQTDSMDLVTCQALLINLPDPQEAIDEFARVTRDTVAVIEPDNAAVSVDSSLTEEPALERRARRAFLAGVETDVTLGADAADLLEAAGLTVVDRQRYDHERTIEPPYSDGALEDAKRKATGAGLASDRETLRAGGLDHDALDQLRHDWRAMGRRVVEQMQEETYHRREVVPFYVTVATV
ncbi:MAG: class I SAM-dependent methyltransferase [Natrialbaceae archaeon]|nr:class I SAM-dependent methyltransferase [Natrialbaceae archaeon]